MKNIYLEIHHTSFITKPVYFRDSECIIERTKEMLTWPCY